MTYTIYNILFYLATPYIFLRMLWRSSKDKAYRQRIAERFGYYTFPKRSKSICLHAASLGETLAADSIIVSLLQQYPDHDIVVTNMTISGSRRTQQRFADRLTHVYIPYDTPGAVKRFLKHMDPQLLILVERELWPNLLKYCKSFHIPVLLANGRLPDRSAERYAKILKFTLNMLSGITCFAVNSEYALKNFLKLGVPSEKIKLCGNIKFDAKINEDMVQAGKHFKNTSCKDRFVWIAASTHEGEEEIILNAHSMILEQFPNALLVLVPRHPERFASVLKLCENKNFTVSQRSKNESLSDNISIFLGDTMGEMFFYYSISDVAFVAGSLKPIGGHNLLEPAAVGVPVVTGTQLFNFREGEALFKAANAMILVENQNELANAIIDLFKDKEKRQQFSERGIGIVNSNKGSVKKHMDIIAELMN